MLDWAVISLAICLAGCIAGIVLITIFEGAPALAGTGLGALTSALGGALVWRVKAIQNGGPK